MRSLETLPSLTRGQAFDVGVKEGLPMLVGYVDNLSASAVGGWAADTDAPSGSVAVAVYLDEARVATAVCDRERQDLRTRADLLGQIHHGFRVEFSPPLDLRRLRQVKVRFATSGELLTNGSYPGERREPLDPILVTAPGRRKINAK